MNDITLGERLRQSGVSRRGFMKFCAATASMMALPPMMIPKVAAALEQAKKPSVIWLAFQECTACTESLTRSHAPSIEGLIFDHISLDYHHTLQAAAGDAAELARKEAMKDHWGEYLVIVDGSIPMGENGAYSAGAGHSNLETMHEVAEGAAAIIAVGTCAAYGGLPMADPNPTGAVSVEDVVTDKPIVNVPGCPPIPTVITGVLAHFLTFGRLPELDHLKRPNVFYGQNIHDRCYRRPFYERGEFAETFDDEGARKGWCLYKLGCKGPTTYNACATAKWNEGTSWPVEAGHGCIGCSEPRFWDAGSFYKALSVPTGDVGSTILTAGAAGLAVGAAAAVLNKKTKGNAVANREPLTIKDLTKES